MTCMPWSPLHGAGGLGRLPGELSAMLRGSLQACWLPQRVSIKWRTLQQSLLAWPPWPPPVMLACRVPNHVISNLGLML